jgi:hypothetical protein
MPATVAAASDSESRYNDCSSTSGETVGKGNRVREVRAAEAVARQEAIHRAGIEPAAVMIRCPVKDEFFSSGIMINPGSFIMSTFKNNTSTCPLCEQNHRWGDSEIVLNN